MPRCGTQVILCDLPVRFDTYVGCSHGCKYCFASKFKDISKVEKGETPAALKKWINGERSGETKWCDWDIPLHWGGMSDPLQPCEKVHRLSYECLKILKESQYPFIISTKGALLGDEEYLELIADCNCVVQISACCEKYDVLEQGATTFAERMEIGKKVSKKGKRLIFRIQPYMHEYYQEIYDAMEQMANAGAYGVVIEGIKYTKKRANMVRVAGDWCIDYNTIKEDFLKLKERGHELGMKVYAGENRLRQYGDSLTCCGIDGMEGFKPNTFNINHLVRGEKVMPTPAMTAEGSMGAFYSTEQTTAGHEKIRRNTFASMMIFQMKKKQKLVSEIFGLNK